MVIHLKIVIYHETIFFNSISHELPLCLATRNSFLTFGFLLLPISHYAKYLFRKADHKSRNKDLNKVRKEKNCSFNPKQLIFNCTTANTNPCYRTSKYYLPSDLQLEAGSSLWLHRKQFFCWY